MFWTSQISKTLLTASLVIAISGSLMAEDQKPEKSEDGFVSLFDGVSLKGWSHQTQTPEPHIGCKFEVADGNLIGDQGPNHSGGFLMTDASFKDFELRFQGNFDQPSDTGVFIRMAENGKSQQITLDNRPRGQFGSIYIPWAQGRVHANPDGIKAFHQGQWNDFTVRVEGEPARIRLWINDKLVTDFQHTEASTKDAPTEGRIAFQVHPNVPNLIIWEDGNKVRFRNIRVKELERK